MKILVTGTSGSIGGAIATRLRRGHEVRGIDLVRGPATTELADLADAARIDALMPGVEAIVHVASLHAPHVGVRSEADFQRTNVLGTAVLLEAARRHGVQRLVYTSTTSVFGRALVPTDRAVWVTEDLEPQPRDIYDQTKLAAEALCCRAAERGDLRVVVLRMSRCFSESPAEMLLHRLHRGVDARDVAEAHVLALRHPANFRVFLISAPTPFREADVVELWRDAPALLRQRCPEICAEFARAGWNLPPRLDRVYCIERAVRELGYHPRFDYRVLLPAG